MKYLESNHLLATNQFGYRSKRLSEHATASFRDKIRRSIDQSLYILVKAWYYRSFYHQQEVTKIWYQWFRKRIGCPTISLAETNDYATKTLSSPSPICCGVLEVSILGSLLILLICNDSTESICTCQMLMYADDNMLSSTHIKTLIKPVRISTVT